jgi:hypothetical protein
LPAAFSFVCSICAGSPGPNHASATTAEVMVFHNTKHIVVGHKMAYHNLIERDLWSDLPDRPIRRMEPEFHEA